MDERFEQGARLFDEGAFFEAHEAWEACWRDARNPSDRLFYQGLVQVAAAFHKRFVVGDVESTQRLLARGLAKLEAVRSGVPPAGVADRANESAPELDLERLCAELRRCAEAASALTRGAVPRLRAR